MQLVSTQIENYQKNSSWIRRMFEAGIELKKKYGEEAVCDFSLGNPDLTPPKAIIDGIITLLGYGKLKVRQTAEGMEVSLPQPCNNIAPVLKIAK